ncbi:MAG: hypothetical protein WA860_04690 [Acidimicrobiales bacterium]
MTGDELLEPYELVEVNFDNSDYRNVCDTFGGGFELEIKWIQLANLLVGRPGWHFDVANHGMALWNLGDFGSSNLNISVTPEGFNCYNYLADDSVVLPEIEQVSAWLEPIEDESRHFPAELAAALDWEVLLDLKFVLRVDVIGKGYCAEIKGMAGETILGDSLREILDSARRKIIGYFRAPIDLAERLLISAQLNEAAVRLMTQK